MPSERRKRGGYGAAAFESPKERMNGQLNALGESVARIIRREMATNGVKNNRELVQILADNGFSICESALGKRMNQRMPWDLPSLFAVADALNMSSETRAALLGGGRR